MLFHTSFMMYYAILANKKNSADIAALLSLFLTVPVVNC